MGKEAYYFSHDYNARHDPKICALKSDYGLEGYGCFWVIIEMLAEQDNYKLPLNQVIISALSVELMKDKKEVEIYIKDCIEKYELFKTDDNYIWSESLLRRMKIKDEKLNLKRKAGKKGAKTRWDKKKDLSLLKHKDSNVISDAWQCHSTAIAKDSKGKEMKEKEKKENNNKVIEKLSTTTITSLSDSEKQILNLFKNIDNYPFDYETDLDHIRELAVDYPHINLFDKAKEWNTYKKDKPLKKNSNARLQFRNFIKKAEEWRKEKSFNNIKIDEKEQRQKRLKLQQERADKYG